MELNKKFLALSLNAANFTYQKEYKKSLEVLAKAEQYAISRDEVAQYNVDLALNYENLGETEKCNKCCENAIALRHSGAYAYERLIKNYVRVQDWKNALRVCDVVFLNFGMFNEQTGKGISEYATKRQAFILKKMAG